MLTYTLIFRTLMEHKAFLSKWCRTLKYTTEREDLFLNTLEISLAPTPQEGLFQAMFVATHHTQEQQELNRVSVCSRTLMHSISLASDVDFEENIVSVPGSHEPFLICIAPLLPILRPWQH